VSVWSDQHLVGKLGKISLGLSAVLAFAAALAALLPISSLWAAVLALLAGLGDVFSFISARRKERLEEAFKKTPPQVEASLQRNADGSFVVLIRPLNDVPFECDWRVVTKNDVVVSGISLEWAKVVPKQHISVYREHADLDLDKVRDEYVELRFSFRSVFASDYPELTLSDRIFCPYRLRPSGVLEPFSEVGG